MDMAAYSAYSRLLDSLKDGKSQRTRDMQKLAHRGLLQRKPATPTRAQMASKPPAQDVYQEVIQNIALRCHASHPQQFGIAGSASKYNPQVVADCVPRPAFNQDFYRNEALYGAHQLGGFGRPVDVRVGCTGRGQVEEEGPETAEHALSGSKDDTASKGMLDMEPPTKGLRTTSHYIIKNTFVEPAESPPGKGECSARAYFSEQPRFRSYTLSREDLPLLSERLTEARPTVVKPLSAEDLPRVLAVLSQEDLPIVNDPMDEDTQEQDSWGSLLQIATH